jgi:hypothetical protein
MTTPHDLAVHRVRDEINMACSLTHATFWGMEENESFVAMEEYRLVIERRYWLCLLTKLHKKRINKETAFVVY